MGYCSLNRASTECGRRELKFCYSLPLDTDCSTFENFFRDGAAGENRTHDPILTKDVLYP